MNMQQHILAALREKFEGWEELLASLSEEQVIRPLAPSDWSIKDNIAHLWAWQQRSIARVEAARSDREPEYPQWAPGADPEEVDNTDVVNGWIYAANRELPWATVHQNWKAGFQRLLESAAGIPEINLLDSGRYPWLNGYSLAYILVASYDHHQEHYEKLLAWLEEHRKRDSAG